MRTCMMLLCRQEVRAQQIKGWEENFAGTDFAIKDENQGRGCRLWKKRIEYVL
jgi:hypothetical protein